MKTTKNSFAYYALIILATTLWGSAFAGAKIAFEFVPPILLSGLRFTLAGLILIPVLLFMKVPIFENLKHWRYMLLFGFIQTFMQYGLFYMGLDLVPGAIAAIIIGAGPLFTAVLAHFTMKNEKFGGRKLFAIALGLAGVVSISISGDPITTDNDLFMRGVILLVISNIVGSYTNIMVSKKGNIISPVMLTMFANLTGGILLFITSIFVESLDSLNSSLPLEFYGALIWLAIIPAAGFSAWYYVLAIPDVKVSELNIWKFIVPIVGVVLSWWLVPDEYPTWSTILGIIIISSSVVVLQLPLIYKKRAKIE